MADPFQFDLMKELSRSILQAKAKPFPSDGTSFASGTSFQQTECWISPKLSAFGESIEAADRALVILSTPWVFPCNSCRTLSASSDPSLTFPRIERTFLEKNVNGRSLAVRDNVTQEPPQKVLDRASQSQSEQEELC